MSQTFLNIYSIHIYMMKNTFKMNFINKICIWTWKKCLGKVRYSKSLTIWYWKHCSALGTLILRSHTKPSSCLHWSSTNLYLFYIHMVEKLVHGNLAFRHLHLCVWHLVRHKQDTIPIQTLGIWSRLIRIGTITEFSPFHPMLITCGNSGLLTCVVFQLKHW